MRAQRTAAVDPRRRHRRHPRVPHPHPPYRRLAPRRAGSRALVLCGRPPPLGPGAPVTVIEYEQRGRRLRPGRARPGPGPPARPVPRRQTRPRDRAGPRTRLPPPPTAPAALEPDPELLLHGDFTRDSGHRLMRRALSRKLEFTAVVAATDMVAAGALTALHEAGLERPRRCLTGRLRRHPFARDLYPALTTVHVPYEELGSPRRPHRAGPHTGVPGRAPAAGHACGRTELDRGGDLFLTPVPAEPFQRALCPPSRGWFHVAEPPARGGWSWGRHERGTNRGLAVAGVIGLAVLYTIGVLRLRRRGLITAPFRGEEDKRDNTVGSGRVPGETTYEEFFDLCARPCRNAEGRSRRSRMSGRPRRRRAPRDRPVDHRAEGQPDRVGQRPQRAAPRNTARPSATRICRTGWTPRPSARRAPTDPHLIPGRGQHRMKKSVRMALAAVIALVLGVALASCTSDTSQGQGEPA
ncbi:substrate-binding domain-containing protein [Streptomyces sp. L7]